jgi:tRNA (guanine-N7-)-methyltransferase
MPLLYSHVFDDVAGRVNAEVNPYVGELLAGVEKKTLPIWHGPSLVGLKNCWRQRFSAEPTVDRALVLEVGCHLGKTLRQMASAHPEIDFVGMDITFKRVVTTAKRAAEDGLPNVNVVLASAKQLDLLVGDGELDGVVVFFPDPWSKRRKQLKNRLVNEEFAREILRIVKPGGFFWFKSDQKEYFDGVRAAISGVGFTEVAEPKGLIAETYESTFEARFRTDGIPTYGAKWVKSGISLQC